jgi:hypothetical protein
VGRLADGRDAESGEAGALPIPAELGNALAERQELESVATRWSATEELTADGWRPEHAAQVLRDVADLAREAAAGGRELWYWWSL